MEEAVRANRALWDEWTDIHARSAMYDLEGFRKGRFRLHPLEIEEVGDVRGRTLLHLQCHFGLDTLSWAHRGAVVTGADFSEKAIALARSLSEELSIPARFVCADLYNLPDTLHATFDVVFTSYGVLNWLPDIRRWGQVAGHFVRPGGVFYIADFHPVTWAMDDAEGVSEPLFRYPYFETPEPLAFPVQGSYADPTAPVTQPLEYGWPHGLGEIVTALCEGGLRLEFLREHPYTYFPNVPFLAETEPGVWRWKEGDGRLPLMFSIRATRPL